METQKFRIRNKTRLEITTTKTLTRLLICTLFVRIWHHILFLIDWLMWFQNKLKTDLNETFATCGPADVKPDPKLESRNTYPGNTIWPVFMVILFQLRYVHYANMSMQYTAIFHGCKNVHFQMNFFFIFFLLLLLSALIIREAVLTSTHNPCFGANLKKSIPLYTPVELYKSGV